MKRPLAGLLFLVGMAMPLFALAQGQLFNANLTVTGTINAGTATGTGNAYVLALAPPITAYVTNQCFTFKANFTNTGASSLNINGLGAKPIKKFVVAVLSDVAASEIANGQPIHVCYDGTNMQLVGGGGSGGSGGSGGATPFGQANAAAAAMTNFGGL